jgi:hypothetical protein
MIPPVVEHHDGLSQMLPPAEYLRLKD